MSWVTIAPLFEGHGEIPALRTLIVRIAPELLNTYVEVAQPFRLDSAKMRKPEELAKAVRVQSARIRVRNTGSASMCRVLVDVRAPCWLWVLLFR